MAEPPHKINLDAFSTVDLNKLLSNVMLKLRERDAQDIKKNFVTKSQRVTLEETLARHSIKPPHK